MSADMETAFPRTKRSLRLPQLASPSAPATRVCVVHLVRAVNGPEPLVRFLESWRRCGPGADCDLVLALKGFAGPSQAQPYLAHAEDLLPETLLLPDEGLDLGTYFAVAARLRRPSYCFLNSFSELLVEGWLSKLAAALQQPGVGMAGATGSWMSTRSWVAYALRLPSAYAGLLPERRVAAEVFPALDAERSGEPAPPGGASLRAKLGTLPPMLEQLVAFEPFPAYHLRTNAFVISHSTLARLRLHEIKRKLDAYALESGHRSMTRQLHALGLRTLVVDRDGATYDDEDWPASRTFWHREQEGLLVADNQTRLYANGGIDRRRLLSALAWGGKADPRPAAKGAAHA